MVIKKQITFILCFALLSAGCTVLYNPKISPVKPGMIPEYTFNQSVKVVNGQSTERITVPNTSWDLNLRETTDLAVELTKKELSKKGFQIQDNANKVLQIIIGDVRHGFSFRGMLLSKCTMVLRVRSGSGDYKNYEVYNLGHWPNACDFSITKAVSAMLSDEYIINYLMND